MATLLAVITTDVAADPGTLHLALQSAVARSFNRVSVDGDMAPTTQCCCWHPARRVSK
jgi:glutamate N-acetyltransferase/amino-acid N-acetyltransferase